MKLHIIVVLACILSVVNAVSVNLTHVTLKQELGAHKTMLVMYYAPWCSHSRETLPIWENLSELMAQNSQDKDIFIAKVDCVAEPDAYWQEGIQSFPTIKAYVNYNTIPIVYDGERVANTMWRYFRLLSRQYVEEVTSLDQFNTWQESKLTKAKPFVLALLEPTDSVTDENMRNRKVDGACKKADRVNCVISRSPEVATALGLNAPSVTVFTKFESFPEGGAEEVYTQEGLQVDAPTTRTDLDSLSSLQLSDWLAHLSYPPLVQLTRENSDLIFSAQRAGFQNHFLFLLPDAHSSAGSQILHTLRTVGKRFLGRAVFIYIDLQGLSDYAVEVLESLQVPVSPPAAAVEEAVFSQPVFPSGCAHAVRSSETALRFYRGLNESSALQSEEGIGAWVEGVLSGTVEPLRTSEFEK